MSISFGAGRVVRSSSGLTAVRLYAAGVKRVLPRGGWQLRSRMWPSTGELVFIVGSPRSGTTFLAGAMSALPGFVDLGEMTPLKAVIPELALEPPAEAAPQLRRVIERVRGLGLVRGLRGIEQTPEMAFCVPAALAAYPDARAVHIVRDGRDVVCSLLEKGWLSRERGGSDDARLPYGATRRFWVKPEDADAFEAASDATRAAWAWRTYVSAARAAMPAALEVRYESLARDSGVVAASIAAHLDVSPEPLARSLGQAHDTSIGRYRTDLNAEQLADVEREAGALLRELGYE